MLRPLIALAVLLAFSTVASAQIFHDPRRKTTVGFSVDLAVSPDALVKIVQSVANDSVIRGTFIYAKETEINDADSAPSSNAFKDPPGAGKTFYKVRTKALSPAHFPGDNDIGTVTVRYVVKPISPERARLRIDAVFVEDGRRTLCASDGSVEAAEYSEIMIQVKAQAEAAIVHHRPAQTVAAEQQSAGLQNTLAEEQARLADARAAEQKLEERAKQLQFNTQGRVKSPGVPLKASPYQHSSTILPLEKGEVVSVLATTKYWYRVRSAKGEEGWIYYAFLGPLS